MKRLLTPLFAILNTVLINAQVLNIEEAIQIALSNNYGIRIAQKEKEAIKTDIYPGAVGLFPTVDAGGSGSYSYSSTNQEFNGGLFPSVEGIEASQNSRLGKISASYLIFNGGSRIRSYSRLKASGDLTDVETKITIESAIIQVVNAYYEVVRVRNQIELLKYFMNLSKDRLERIKINNEYGNSTKIDFLNAQVDFNTDSSNYIATVLNLRKSKNELNYLLGRKIAFEFEINGDVKLPAVREASEYIEKAKENSTLVLLANINLNIAELDKKISTSNFMPVISSNLDYGYSGSASDVGVFKSASSIGYTGSVSLKWNLFDGLKKQRALEKAKINIDLNRSKQEQTLLNIEKEVQNYYDALSQNIILLNLEKQNKIVAGQNLERSKYLLNNGMITSLEFRQAQINLFKIENRINNLNYAITVFNYQLLRMTNELVK